ncbi:MAG TPA: beta-propeller domain-containing protein [Polyangiaceae bacterium]
MNRRIDAEIRGVREGYPTYYSYGRNYAVDAAGGAGLAVPTATNGATKETTTSASPTPAHSETETQVQGVDEADIVKADGTRLYVLHGQKFLMVDAWPAPTLALAGGIDIEGEPTEMFVSDGKAVIFSTANGAALYTATGLTPRQGYNDAYAAPMYASADVARGSGSALPSQTNVTKVTVLNIVGNTASVARELYFEGSYLSSRRVEKKVRLVLAGGVHGPVLDYNAALSAGADNSSVAPSTEDMVAAYETLRTKNQEAIDSTNYADWIPIAFSKNGTNVEVDPAACADVYVPSAGSTEFGMTQIVAFNLDAPSDPPRSVGILGATQTVYGDTSSMVLAGRAYVDPWTLRSSTPIANGGATDTTTSVAPPVQSLNSTHLHLFDVSSSDGQPLYVASGTVPGEVKDQFGIDQKDRRVRVATTELRSGPALSDGRQNQVSHVYVLEAKSAAQLVLAGDAGDIAPGEQLYATRYIGDKAYIVTWHITDPLFVIDLANPASPKILGQLKIPGFSEYMHPLDDTHLLTIGRETDDTGHQHTDGGYWYGIAIQVFDVTNPLEPKQQYKYVYDGGEYATSEATQNHKAFTYFDDRKLLAFPYVRQMGWGTTAGSGPSSTLELFHVDLESGIRKIGSIDHSALLETTSAGYYGYCGGYYDGAVRRGVFFEDVVYSISYGGILANDVSSLAQLASLKLEAPTMTGLNCGMSLK